MIHAVLVPDIGACAADIGVVIGGHVVGGAGDAVVVPIDAGCIFRHGRHRIGQVGLSIILVESRVAIGVNCIEIFISSIRR